MLLPLRRIGVVGSQHPSRHCLQRVLWVANHRHSRVAGCLYPGRAVVFGPPRPFSAAAHVGAPAAPRLPHLPVATPFAGPRLRDTLSLVTCRSVHGQCCRLSHFSTGSRRHSSHFASSRIVDFVRPLEDAAEALNESVKSHAAGPSRVWKMGAKGNTARAAYLPFYLFDMEVDVYFKGKLAGRKGYTDEYVFRKVRYHSDGSANSAVDMMVYGSYSYRRNYAHAIKNVNLEAADPVKSALASVSLGSIAESYPPVDRGGVHERPDLDPFEMSQTFAFDMVQERMLKNAKQLAFEYLNKTLGLGAVVDTRVAFKIRRRQCTPMFLPAYVFEYKYLGVRYRALVSGDASAVGGETHVSPFKVGGLAMLLATALFERVEPRILPLVGLATAAVAIQPAVMKFMRGIGRRIEEHSDARAKDRTDWYDWEKSGLWGQWFEAKWHARERQHRRKEHQRAWQQRGHSTTITSEEGEESLYAVLGLQGQEHTANTEDVKRAFRRLALKYHPDAVRHKPGFEQEEATTRFRRILDAYKVLRNKNLRAHYDKTGQVKK